MNPFSNPAMFEQMKRNMTPEMMKNATQQMNNMSDEDLKRMGQQSGMNISPEMMRMASNMFSGMDENQMKNMMNMSQNMSPNQFQQAQQKFSNSNQNQPSSNTQSSSSKAQQQPIKQSKEASVPPPPVDNSLYPSITSLKNKGNEKFKAQDWEGAGTFYLEAIISIEEEKLKNLNSMQEKELKDIEISCRNNYCSVKAKQNDYHSLLIQSQAVIKLDPTNIKAKFRLGQGYYGLNKFERALEYLKEAKNGSPGDQIIVDLYNQCKAEVDKIQKEVQKKEQETKKKEETPKKSEDAEKKLEEEVEEKPKKSANKTVKKQEEEQKINKSEEVVIEEIKEQPKKTSQQPANPTLNTPKYDNETIKKQQEMMKNMDDSQLDQMAQMVKNMDNQTLKQLYKSQGMDLSDEQIQMMKQMTTTETLKQTRNIDPEVIQQRNQQAFQHAQTSTSVANTAANNTTTTNTPSFPAGNAEAIKMSQEKLKNMDDDQIDNMAKMMKDMDNSFLKQLYKSQGMELSDDQINMMKNMMTPDMIKTASKMNPDQIPKPNSGNATITSQNQSSSNQSVSQNPQPAAQTMPDMSNMEGMLENTQMIETAFNMIVANPEMLKMMASQLGPNHPFANYLQNSSPEDLKKLVNKLKYLVPVFKYGYKGYKVVKKYKSAILIIILALVLKYFFL